MGWAAFGPPRRTVENWFDCFLKVMERDKGRFKYFVDHNALEIEWVHPVKFVSPLHQEGKVVEWLEKHPTPEWIFIGRLLRRGVDRQILENPDKLGSLIQSVFCGFRYFWEQTQYLMNSS
jgi:hypothetical protein